MAITLGNIGEQPKKNEVEKLKAKLEKLRKLAMDYCDDRAVPVLKEKIDELMKE